MKPCTRCGTQRTLDEFPPDRRNLDGRGSWCRPCSRAAERARKVQRRADPQWMHAQRSRTREWMRAKRARDPDYVEAKREYNRTLKHGITRQQRDELYERQKGRCAGCGRTLADPDLQIDHDHNCCAGEWSRGCCIRGLVCRSCNRRDVLAGRSAVIFDLERVMA